jgi:F0F1-type ATP synthase assembly protein I
MPTEPSRKHPTGFLNQIVLAMELPFVLVGGVAIGGAIGYFLDGKLHTWPWLTLAFGLMGFAAGLRDVLRRLSRAETDGSKDGGG